MLPVLLVCFLVVPAVEIYVIIQVAHATSPLIAVGLLVAVSLCGAWLVRREGLRTWRGLRSALGTGRLPAREVADGALLALGGALLLTPGFVTDALGLLLVLPPTRALARRLLISRLTRRALVRRVPTSRTDRWDADVIEGEVVGEVVEPPRRSG